MTVGSGIEKQGGCVLLYRSSDLRQWEYLHPLASGEWNGRPNSNPCDDGEMWECPDFFKLDGAHVLIYSTLGKVFWQSGVFNPETLHFEATKTGLLDVGAFYAPKTQLDAHGRRIVWGWLPERRSKEEMLAAGWSGMMSLPRQLRLDSDGQLRINFAEETTALRGKAIPLSASNDGKGKSSVAALLPRVNGEFMVGSHDPGHASQCVVQVKGQKILEIHYMPGERTFLIDDERLELRPNDSPSLHGFVDGSVIELLVAERIGCTKRFYYAGDVGPDVEITGSGESVNLQAWKVKPISANRLTAV
jgi:beta-fructofuranosidase